MDEEFEVEAVWVPIHVAMMWAVILTPITNDVCSDWRLRQLAHMIVPQASMEAAHWAGHKYLRRCTHNAQAPWLN